MAAHNNLNPDQLKMFMSANEIKGQYQPLDGDREGYEDDNEVWDRKLSEASAPKPYYDMAHEKVVLNSGSHLDHLKTHGVTQPVHLGNEYGSSGRREVVGGHHRVAVMSHLSPDQLMPVLHHEDIWEAQSPVMHKAYPYT